jgi:biofilm PGA synthesis N-glycosyltransferase PgaC
MSATELAFISAAGLICYTYALYPTGIWIVAKLRRSEPAIFLPDEALPPVTAIISAHNEESRVLTRLRNLRALNYPQDRLQVIFVSDGSTDRTEQVLRGEPGVTVIAYPQRMGKAHAINTAMKNVKTPVVLFCDARQEATTDSLRAIVSTLMHPGNGVVSADLVHRVPGTQVAASIGLYWKYEKWIRRSESAARSVVGATGAFYAVRTELFRPLESGTLLDDFETPMQIVAQGHAVRLDERAVVFDELQSEMTGERKRKLRTLGGNFQSFARHPWMFLPWRNPIWTEFISHKVMRLVVPYAMIVALLASLLTTSPWLQTLGALQLAFYAAALAGMRFHQARRNRLIAFATVFVDLNWTALKAGLQFAAGSLDTRWDKT